MSEEEKLEPLEQIAQEQLEENRKWLDDFKKYLPPQPQNVVDIKPYIKTYDKE